MSFMYVFFSVSMRDFRQNTTLLEYFRPALKELFSCSILFKICNFYYGGKTFTMNLWLDFSPDIIIKTRLQSGFQHFKAIFRNYIYNKMSVTCWLQTCNTQFLQFAHKLLFNFLIKNKKSSYNWENRMILSSPSS